ncbi:MAG: hypothetical protein F6K11_34200 [Leptolyngbya sp. SIO3F4]|nr:hypothetical protein [Leptolyngbya sp. SIO3F4]
MPHEDLIAKENGLFSDALGDLLRSGSIGLSKVPNALKKAISNRVWENLYIHQTNSYVQHPSIRQWIEEYPPEGLGSRVATVEALIQDDTSLLVEFKQVVAGELQKVGAPQKNTNATKNKGSATTFESVGPDTQDRGSSYLLARMKRDLSEDDFQEAETKVKSGAAINAVARDYGIKKTLVRISWAEDADPQAVAGKLFEKCELDFLVQVVAILNDALVGKE